MIDPTLPIRVSSPYQLPTDAHASPAPAPDVVQLDGDAEAHTSGWKRVGLAAALGVVAAVGLAGCGSSTPEPPPVCTTVPATPTNQAAQALEAQSSQDQLAFKVVPEGTTRIDIVRQTETKRDSDGNSREEDVDYSQFGVYLGNGLFHDTNGNLALIPEMAFDEPFLPQGSSTVCVDGPWRDDWRTYPEGDGVKVDGPWGNDFSVTRRGDVVKVDGPWSADYTFIKSGNTVKLDGPWSADYTFTRSGDTVHSDGPWNDDYTVDTEGSRTRVDTPWNNDWTITREGNTLRVDGPWKSDWTITREGGVVNVDGPWKSDYRIEHAPPAAK